MKYTNHILTPLTTDGVFEEVDVRVAYPHCPHPGMVLAQDFLADLGITAEEFAQEIGISAQRVKEIIRGERCVTFMTALRFAGYFGTTPEFWVSLQERHDAARADGEIIELPDAPVPTRRQVALPGGFGITLPVINPHEYLAFVTATATLLFVIAQ